MNVNSRLKKLETVSRGMCGCTKRNEGCSIVVFTSDHDSCPSDVTPEDAAKVENCEKCGRQIDKIVIQIVGVDTPIPAPD